MGNERALLSPHLNGCFLHLASTGVLRYTSTIDNNFNFLAYFMHPNLPHFPSSSPMPVSHYRLSPADPLRIPLELEHKLSGS